MQKAPINTHKLVNLRPNCEFTTASRRHLWRRQIPHGFKAEDIHSPQQLVKLPFGSETNLICSITMFFYAHLFFFTRQLTGTVATEHARATGLPGMEPQGGLTWLQLSTPFQTQTCWGRGGTGVGGPSPGMLAHWEVRLSHQCDFKTPLLTLICCLG